MNSNFKKHKTIYILCLVSITIIGSFLIFNSLKYEKIPHKYQRWINDIELPEVINDYTGKGVTIAIIDTAISIDHPDLSNTDIETIQIANVSNDKSMQYDKFHGTSIAGIIGGYPANNDGIIGIAPKSKILSLVFSTIDTADSDNLVKCINAAIEKKPDIINISLGTTKPSEELFNAIKSAFDKGIIIVAAAGDGKFGKLQYPAGYNEVISVGALFKDNDFYVSDDLIPKINVFAPGKNIVTTTFINGKNDYMSGDGSSLSTAIVSGIIALVKEAKHDITTKELKEYFSKNKIINAKEIVNYFRCR